MASKLRLVEKFAELRIGMKVFLQCWCPVCSGNFHEACLTRFYVQKKLNRFGTKPGTRSFYVLPILKCDLLEGAKTIVTERTIFSRLLFVLDDSVEGKRTVGKVKGRSLPITSGR